MKKILLFMGFAVIMLATANAVQFGSNSRGMQPQAFRAPTLPTPSNPTPTSPTNPVNPTNPTTPAAPANYSVEGCMRDLEACVGGGLQGGVAALYNTDMRNSVINGMNLCHVQVDKCVNEAIRVDGKKAYYARADVWTDFNSRVVQPQYYNHVLMKTGLTPNQAENTCWLLDKNVGGSSFSSVTAAQQDATAPLGQVVNKDWARNQFARWDATEGECLIRVAAYNKDKLIEKEWLGVGMHGPGGPAEVWSKAGTNITCKKELFDYNLMNVTKTVALYGIAGGTVVGATIGGIVTGTGENRTFKLDAKYCDNKDFITNFNKALTNLGEPADVTPDTCNITVSRYMEATAKRSAAEEGMQEALRYCDSLQGRSILLKELAKEEDAEGNVLHVAFEFIDIPASNSETSRNCREALTRYMSPQNEGSRLGALRTALRAGGSAKVEKKEITSVEIEEELERIGGLTWWQGALIGGGAGAVAGGVATAITAFIEHNNIKCRIGNNLDSVEFGKSKKIDTLKDYYVKWALRLPDTVMPQQIVSDCASWNTACGSIVNINDCATASVTYKPTNSNTSTQVGLACVVSGNTCVANNPIATSYGACP